MRGIARAIGWCLAASLAASACTGGDARPRQSPGTIEGELVSTDDALPEEFPGDFPLPGSPTILYSAVSALGSVVYLDSGDPSATLAEQLLDRLPDAGWKVFSCVKTRGDDEDTFFITAGKGRAVASVLVGFVASNAERIGGRRYSYLVSIANDAPEPISTEQTCLDD